MSKRYNQLPQVAFSILLALALKPRHGYEIMKQIGEDSNGKIKLVPGALYASIKHLYEQGLVEEIDNPTDKRRRLYQLTASGRNQLNAELKFYDNTLKLAKQRKAFESVLGAGR